MNEDVGSLLPHTRISPMTRISIERILPAPGKILVQVGERVEASQKIARIPARGEIQVVNVARILDLDNRDLSRVMVKKRGERVEAGEMLATRQGALPFFHKPCRSPITGRLVAIGYGWVVIQGETDAREGPKAKSEAIDLPAFVAGQVTAIRDQRSVTIETVGAYITGACSIGGEGNGILQIAVTDPLQTLTADDIGMGANSAILVGGTGLSPEAVDRAREMKVKGIIVGGISSSLHDLRPAPSFPIVGIEGYGGLPMSSSVFNILKQLEGHAASISGQMDEVWGNSRPAIIVPLSEHESQDKNKLPGEDMSIGPGRIGHRVRAVRHPLLGQIGEIASIPATPQQVPSGLSLSGAQIALVDTGYPSFQREVTPGQDMDRLRPSSMQFVPWLNLERIS